ncbi:MAG: helix-turn-helix domain-containing protein [Oscillospiraceae bacterium]|nr:helix-turn-helix domain-containing protein [Oscillospiraceae bacterium]
MNFTELLIRAKATDADAVGEILKMYRPLLMKESLINGVFDEDLYQELCITLMRCIRKIKI